MAIKGLTDKKAAFPRVGKLRKGGPRPENGKALGKTWITSGSIAPIPVQLRRSKMPTGTKVLVKAVAPFSENDMVKAAGFKWNRPDLIPRAWAKRMPREDAEALPFAVEVLG